MILNEEVSSPVLI